MLSLPLIPPQDDDSAFLRATYRPRPDSPPPLGVLPATQQPQHQQRDEQRKKHIAQHNARSPLAQLAIDETSLAHRKSQVRAWGSSWIRPPGITKTLQAMNEEALEREEQAELERQEAGVRDMQAQQQLQEAQQQAEETGTQDADDEVDLDEAVPVAPEDVTFNEDSMMEGSQIEGGEEDLDEDDQLDEEEAILTGAVRDEEELGMDIERDLDQSIPEAGSYQHTDTEVEDSDSDSELVEDSIAGGSTSHAAMTPVDRTNMSPTQMSGFQQRMRAQVSAADALPRSPGSLNLSSSILDSSMVGSSPVVQRGNARGRGGRTRRGRES